MTGTFIRSGSWPIFAIGLLCCGPLAQAVERTLNQVDCRPGSQPFLNEATESAVKLVMDRVNDQAPKGSFGCRTFLDSAQERAVFERLEAFSQGIRGELSAQRALERMEANYQGSKEQIALQKSANLMLTMEILKQRIAAKSLTGADLTSEAQMIALMTGISPNLINGLLLGRQNALAEDRKALLEPLANYVGITTQVKVDAEGRPDFREYDLARAIRDPRLLGGLSSYFGEETFLEISDPSRRKAVVFDGYVYLPLRGSHEEPGECDRIRSKPRPRHGLAPLAYWRKQQRGCQITVMSLDEYQQKIAATVKAIEDKVPEYLRKSKEAHADWAAHSSNVSGSKDTEQQEQVEWKILANTIRGNMGDLMALGLDPKVMEPILETWQNMSRADADNLSKGIKKLDSAITAVKYSAAILAGAGALSALSGVSAYASAAFQAGMLATAQSFASEGILYGIGITSDAIVKGENPLCFMADQFVSQSGEIYKQAAIKGAVSAVMGGASQSAKVTRFANSRAVTLVGQIKSLADIGLAVKSGIVGAKKCQEKLNAIDEGALEVTLKAQIATAVRDCAKAGLDILRGVKGIVSEGKEFNQARLKDKSLKPDERAALEGEIKKLEQAENFFKKDPSLKELIKKNKDNEWLGSKSLSWKNKTTVEISKADEQAWGTLKEIAELAASRPALKFYEDLLKK